MPDGTGSAAGEGDTLTVSGRVSRAETRMGPGGEITVLYLDAVYIYHSQASGREAELSFSAGSSFPHGLICETEEERPPLGSYILVKGLFSQYSKASNPGQFDARQYYRTMDIAGCLRKAAVLETDGGHSFVGEELYRLRCRWRDRLYSCFPEREASVLCAMLLGDKTSLDSEIKALYQRSGIIHILSISGLHITLLGMGIYRLLRRLGCPAWASALCGGVLLVLYGVMTGLGVSACRAVGMYLIRMLGEILGRTYDMLTALGVMLAAMLLYRPEYILHSGFLLSFGSICGIGILLPALSGENQRAELAEAGRIRRLAAGFWERLRQSILAGVSITLFTLPVQLGIFYEIPVYSVFLNLLVLPLMGIVVAVGFLVMLVPGTEAVGMAAVKILEGYEALGSISGKLPFHTWSAGCPAWQQILAYYLLLAALVLLGKNWKAVRKAMWLTAMVIIIGIRYHPGMSVTFLDVGQGDCIFVRTPAGEVYLFDGGSSTEKEVGKRRILPYLKYQGVDHVDAVFVSHPDSDHCNGILELLEEGAENNITIGRLILPAINEEQRQEELGQLLESAGADPRISIGFLARGDTWESGGAVFSCLHPPYGFGGEDANAYSECLLVRYGAFSMLLTGDVQGDGEKALTEELRRMDAGDITVLKTAHHGSRNSTPRELLSLISPRFGVISCAEDNSYGHPHPELLERLRGQGTTIYMTPETGALELRVKGGELRLKPFLK